MLVLRISVLKKTELCEATARQKMNESSTCAYWFSSDQRNSSVDGFLMEGNIIQTDLVETWSPLCLLPLSPLCFCSSTPSDLLLLVANTLLSVLSSFLLSPCALSQWKRCKWVREPQVLRTTTWSSAHPSPPPSICSLPVTHPQ